tara:strand:- start:5121 stop:6119 length:999 start_codon:yes stop_codon:yes gene_type:complete
MNPLQLLLGLVTRPLKDLAGLSPTVEEAVENSPDMEAGISYGGLNNDVLAEPIPDFVPARGERVISNNSNAWIVIGRDRPSNDKSGYGGIGATGAGSVDIVAGRKPLNPETLVSNNYITDSARVVVSQMTDIDKNFGLVDGSIGNIEARSAVGMKADEVRIVARNGIKLVTEGRGSTNSNNGKIKTTVGIDLIAGNDDNDMTLLGAIRDVLTGDGKINPTLQPIPKGLEVVDALHEIMAMMDSLAAIVNSNTFALHQTQLNLASHFHISPFLGIPTTPSPLGAAFAMATSTGLGINATLPMYPHRINTQFFRKDYLTVDGSKWICSRYNNTN